MRTVPTLTAETDETKLAIEAIAAVKQAARLIAAVPVRFLLSGPLKQCGVGGPALDFCVAAAKAGEPFSRMSDIGCQSLPPTRSGVSNGEENSKGVRP